jgi:Sec-independent protein secretion pathway component TatC
LLAPGLIGEGRVLERKVVESMKTKLLALMAVVFSLPALADEVVSTSAEGIAAISASAVTVVVPAPAALALFGVAVAGLVIARRLRKR